VKCLRLMLLMTLTTVPLWAASQLGIYTRVVAQVPFDFIVGDKVIPAGELIVQPATAADETISIRNTDAKIGLFSPTSPVETRKAAGASALIFHKYGDRYFLSAIRLEGTRTSYEVPQSRAETELNDQKAPFVENITVTSLK